jgi:uncharacterized protein (DUF1501 family)
MGERQAQAGALDRRDLLAVGALGALAWPWAPRVRSPRAEGRTLVLLQLTGGNDGLSTVVPHADDRYRAARPELGRGAGEVLVLDDYRGLHAGLERLFGVWSAGKLAVVEGVGYPDATRSHFHSLDVWHAADPRGREAGEGWVARLVERGLDDDPDPNRTIHVGFEVPFALHSLENPPTSFVRPGGYRWIGAEAEVRALAEASEDSGPRPGNSGLDHVRAVLRAAQSSSARVRQAANKYRTPVEYPPSPLGLALRDIAALIAGELGTRVFSVEQFGFDTHVNQAAQHDNLMRTLDAALGAFLEDLERSEAGRRTVVMAYSEFGRRVEENGTLGTDHGLAAPVLVAGAEVRGGLYGKHPSLEELDGGDLAHTTDFRRVYATLIERWFDADSRAVLGARYEPLDFLERA